MGTKEYHAQKNKEWYERVKATNPERLKARKGYTAERRRNSKSFWVKEHDSKCAHCYNEYPDCVFDFHHTNPTEKDLQPSYFLHLRKEKIEEEIKKCIMLCSNCHRIEHARLKYDAHSKRNN